MNDNMMHGYSAIVASVLLLIYLPLLVRYLVDTPRSEWLSSQPILFALGLVMEAAGVGMISFYRTAQIWLLGGTTLTNIWTTFSLAFLVAGGVVLVRAATLDHGKWKWRVLLVLCCAWTIYAMVWTE